mmetsp:Transcript_5200/g.15862  ORF Transcript_5200/g.15862 Transcript_5200/m.15862 type:complete len:212 (+) Transcript_5200:978-1613(+)
MPAAMVVQREAFLGRPSAMILSTSFISGLSTDAGSGMAVLSAAYLASHLTPSWISSVASPPSSTIMLGPLPLPQSSAWLVHHQYSSSVSPFHANTAAESRAIAAAAWSCVEKMLHEHQRTLAPSAVSVSIRTAVWMVMCREPVISAPASGCLAPYSRRHSMRPGISSSARVISMRPKSASAMSFTLYSLPEAVVSVTHIAVVPTMADGGVG